MKRIFFIIPMLFLAVLCFGQQPRLVVLPLENRAGAVQTANVETLTELVVNNINGTRRFTVIDRSALNAMMTAQQWQMDDWADEAKTAEMGKVLNAQYIVRGTVSALGYNMVVSTRILDINTAEVLGAASIQVRSTMDDAYDQMAALARNLTSDIGTTAPPRQTQQTPQTQQTSPRTSEPRDAPRVSSTSESSGSPDTWKKKWVYIGPTLGLGYVEGFFMSSFTYEEEYWSDVPLYVGLVVDANLLPWLSLTVDFSLGFMEDFYFTMPMRVRLGGKPGNVEITGNIGYAAGSPGGFLLGATLGFRMGSIGAFYMDFDYLPVSDTWGDEGFALIFNLGWKFGIGNKR